MEKFYSLLTNAGTGEQSSENYIGSSIRWIPYIVGLIALMIGIYSACIFEWVGFIYFFVCMILSVVGNNKPSIFHTMPIDYKKRTMYYFADLIIITLLVFLTMIAVIALIIGFCMIGDALIGIETVEESAEAEEVNAITISAVAIWFSVFRTLFFCSGITGLSRIQNKKYNLILMLAFILIYVIGGVCLTLAVAGGSEYTMLLWFYENFDKLPMPWLATSLCGLFAVGACVGSVLYILRIEKPKAF